jgi:hypothetical protein
LIIRTLHAGLASINARFGHVWRDTDVRPKYSARTTGPLPCAEVVPAEPVERNVSGRRGI